MFNWKRLSLFVVMFFALLLAACSGGVTTASCAFVAGTGGEGYDAKLHTVIYPGQRIAFKSGEKVTYVPCNSRNYIINNGNVRNANGDIVGDRGTLIVATTKTGTAINIAARALWTLNQTPKAIADFYTVCFKYQCASENDIGGNKNYSTAGWNGMLAENFGPAMDAAARQAAISVNDDIWQKHDPSQYKALSDGMSAAFADAVRANLGFPEDLFCGSGNSAWSNPNNPGEGTFTCSPVRIIVDDVQRGQVQANESAESVYSLNEQRLRNAKALYGEDAGFWLGLHDTIDKCKAASTTCIVNIGGTGGGPAVALPPNNPAPTPTPVKK